VARQEGTVANIGDYFRQQLGVRDKLLYRHFESGQWRDVSAGEVGARIGRWQAALVALGLSPGDRVAICLRNGVEWIGLDLAALGLGLVVVPLYVDDSPDNIAWCIANAGARLLVVETTKMANALKANASELPPNYVRRADAGDTTPTVASLLPATAQEPQFGSLPDATLATICYTSGTAGRPKGVMLSHANIIANVTACQQTGMARPTDLFLSILPLSHMFERTGGYYLPLSIGARVVYARGVAELAEDLASQAPTIMFAVPRIFEKFSARLEQALAGSALKGWLFGLCVGHGWRVESGQGNWLDRQVTALLRRLVARPVLARLGGRMRLAIVSGAALDPHIAHTFIGLGLTMLQGYGMTEASPVISVNREGANDPESVGPPLPGVEVKLDAGGELLARGGNVMRGYWHNDEATQAAIDAEGWLHTGDVAELRGGKIYIRGRVKDIMVMSNGEKLPPQDAEFALLRDPMFEQVMLVGEGRPFLTLLAVTSERDQKTLIAHANEQLKTFPRWVRVRHVIPTPDAWSIDNGLLTPTLKLKRPLVLSKFKDAIDAVYGAESKGGAGREPLTA